MKFSCSMMHIYNVIFTQIICNQKKRCSWKLFYNFSYCSCRLLLRFKSVGELFITGCSSQLMHNLFSLIVATKKVKPPNKKRFEEDLEQISNRIRDLEIEQVCHRLCLGFFGFFFKWNTLWIKSISNTKHSLKINRVVIYH